MDTLIIGCKTLQNELQHSISECCCDYDVKWVESGLHSVPKKLTEALQNVLDSSADYSLVLMAMGYCGNALIGIRTGNMTLIVPRVDDCISLLLGPHTQKEISTYFMTEGWLRGERNILREYEYTVQKYGVVTGTEIFDVMFRHYSSLAVLDTNCFDLHSIEGEFKHIATTLKLEYRVIPATIEYMKALLLGPWDDNSFLTIPPWSVISQADLSTA